MLSVFLEPEVYGETRMSAGGMVVAVQESLSFHTPLRGMVRIQDYLTSIEAAEAVQPHLSDLQAKVLAYIEERGQVTDAALEAHFGLTQYAYSTIRKRRTDLVAKGLVRACGTGKNAKGRSMTLWEVVK
jgi:predicted HTH transcriptional regulator